MLKIDNTLLIQLGLGDLPNDEKNRLLEQIYETLEMRVGMRLAENMTDEQLDEFESYIDKNDEAGALKWLETNFPDYKRVVEEELETLKAEIQKDSAQILKAASSRQEAPVPADQVAQQSQPTTTDTPSINQSVANSEDTPTQPQ